MQVLKLIIGFILLGGITQPVYSQLSREALGSSPMPQKVRANAKNGKSAHDTLSLPFLEDFSYRGGRPDSRKWINGGVFVNNQFAVDQPTWGVATFDGLNKFGEPYSLTEDHGAADTLTSLPIDLAYPASDSIYLSFYYQPKGRGNYPEFVDTFQLEFKNPHDTVWTWAWSTRGEDFPQSDIRFRHVMIPIKDTAFLKRGFQFRFRNYASLHGGFDHWNLDYIRIDRFRYRNDTITGDYAFMYDPPSLIKTYYSAPWTHFLTNPSGNMEETFTLILKNNSVAAGNRGVGYEYFNRDDEFVDASFTNAGSIPPGVPYSFSQFVKSPYTGTGEWASFRHIYYIGQTGIEDLIPRNDTIEYLQILSNYYALDDGTAEERIGLTNNGGGFVAQRFETWMADTLKSIQVYFNKVNGVQPVIFNLMVWGAGSNVPGELILATGELQANQNEGLNQFQTFVLETPVYLPAGTYYFGWAQSSPESISIGFDRNTDGTGRIYYNQSGTWHEYFAQEGVLMIRPMFREPFDIYVTTPSPVVNHSAHVYPNPAGAETMLVVSGTNTNIRGNYSIVDLSGRTVMQGKLESLSTVINLYSIDPGIYIINYECGEVRGSQKLIVNR